MKGLSPKTIFIVRGDEAFVTDCSRIISKGKVSFYFESPDFVNYRIPEVRAGMGRHLFIFQPGIGRSIEQSIDLVHHTAEGVPADPSLYTLPIKPGRVAHPMSERTFSFLFDDFYLNPIGSFHLLTMHLIPTTPERVYGNRTGSSCDEKLLRWC
jgi:hypothetical protein